MAENAADRVPRATFWNQFTIQPYTPNATPQTDYAEPIKRKWKITWKLCLYRGLRASRVTGPRFSLGCRTECRIRLAGKEGTEKKVTTALGLGSL